MTGRGRESNEERNKTLLSVVALGILKIHSIHAMEFKVLKKLWGGELGILNDNAILWRVTL